MSRGGRIGLSLYIGWHKALWIPMLIPFLHGLLRKEEALNCPQHVHNTCTSALKWWLSSKLMLQGFSYTPGGNREEFFSRCTIGQMYSGAGSPFSEASEIGDSWRGDVRQGWPVFWGSIKKSLFLDAWLIGLTHMLRVKLVTRYGFQKEFPPMSDFQAYQGRFHLPLRWGVDCLLGSSGDISPN